jgi:hypothetical protein
MARKTQTVSKEVESVNIEFADNGFILTYSGRDDQDNWTDAKIILHNFKEVFEHVENVYNLGRQ